MYEGIYRGIVSGAADPAQQGRVQISVPSLGAASSSWASTCLPPDARVGYRSGQRVWVMFENGNVDFPVVMGVMSG